MRSSFPDNPSALRTTLHHPAPDGDVTSLISRAPAGSIFEHSVFGMATLDLEGRILALNAATEAKFAYPSGELAGVRIDDLVHPDDRADFTVMREGVLAGVVRGDTAEYRIRAASGEYISTRVGLSVVCDVAGEPLFLLAVGADMSRLRQKEAALQASEQRFRSVVESLGEGLVITDLDDVIVYVNTRTSQLTGYGPEELLGRVATDLLLPQEERERVREEVSRRAQGYSGRYEVQHLHKDGQRLWLDINAVPYRNPDGEIMGSLALLEDITERRLAEQALGQSEQYFRSLTENAPDLIHVINADRTTRYFSPSVKRLLGYEPEALVGGDAQALIHPDDLEPLVETIRKLRPTGQSRSVELRVRHHDGSWRTFEAVVRNRVDDPVVSGIIINSRDITGRKRTEEEGLRLAALSRENPNPVLECDASGRPVHVNPAAEEIARRLGLGGVRELLPENHAQLVKASLKTGEGFQNVEVAVGDCIFCWSYRPHLPAHVVHLFAVDITSRRMMEEQLRHDALHDALTGLPNRLLFMERLAHAIVRSKRRENYLFAVLFLDLDRFKIINDSLGHHVGDELLMLVSSRLQDCLRTEDTVARLGGDEFAILLEDIGGIGDATRIAERIQQGLAEPVNLSGFEVFTSASIGIALSSSAYERPEYLLRNADMAMYRAKASGQARFEVFDRAMHADALARLQMETDLRRALERGEFQLHYQPIVEMETGRLRAVEALLRWAHPDRGWMEPEDFVPVAEETGIILPIGRWVLEEACARVRQWQERFGENAPATVAVNLSAKQFSQADMVEQITHALESSGLGAQGLRLEITESAVVENADAAVVLLERLKAIGVEISLDDFGTGYSSLSYLHRFPLDALKIDRSFVGRLNEEERSAQLVQTILALARSLGVAAVAEGVETPAQLAALQALGCHFGQGYLFAPPLSPDEMEERLANAGPAWEPLAR